MFENFTPAVQDLYKAAERTARQFGQPGVCPWHILYHIPEFTGTLAAEALETVLTSYQYTTGCFQGWLALHKGASPRQWGSSRSAEDAAHTMHWIERRAAEVAQGLKHAPPGIDHLFCATLEMASYLLQEFGVSWGEIYIQVLWKLGKRVEETSSSKEVADPNAIARTRSAVGKPHFRP